MYTPAAKYFDRDLSWLSFNYRILQEAAREDVPLYERIKFMGIFSSNLDEFFRVRVATLRASITIGKTKFSIDPGLSAEQLLEEILQEVSRQQSEFGKIYREQILPSLEAANIILYRNEEIEEQHRAEVKNYFRNKVMTYLQPVIFREKAKIPFLKNRQVYFALQIQRKDIEGAPPEFALLNIPSDHLDRFYQLSPLGENDYFIFLDDLIRCNLKYVFPAYEILSCHSIKLNRDADLHIEDEFSGDLVDKIKKQLDSRNVGVPSRFLYDKDIPSEVLTFLQETFEIQDQDLVRGGRYHNFNDFMKLPNPKGALLENRPMPSVYHQELDEQDSFLEAIAQKDYILHFPYHSYDYVLRFFNEAAIDPYVSEIKLTVYRFAANSLIANALISAVRNGKKVSVFMEVKARFDEENNLHWAEAMQKEGIKITYSIPGLKVHAKVALVIRKKGKKRQEFAFFGTGNFNEGTAKIYADHGLFTAKLKMTNELNHVFKYLNKRKPIPALKHLLVSQFNLPQRFTQLIEREIQHAKQGKNAKMIIKVNNLEDPIMIDKLYEANQAGVKIELIIRSICGLIPQKEGLSENIRAHRIVDRYLEHARVFIFHNDGDEEIFMGSADWMKRNLYHRIEVVFPIYHPKIKGEIKQIIDFQLRDNQSRQELNSEQRVSLSHKETEQHYRAQQDTYEWVASQLNA